MAMATGLESAGDEMGAERQDAPVGKLATKVARNIETEVMRLGWPVGRSLGSEADLRERFGVSRSVLREAVRLVEHHQVARMRRGPNGGLFVCAPDAGPATRALVIYLEYIGTGVDDLLQARLLLEPMAAGLAAERLTEDGIATLRAILQAEADHQDERGISLQDPLHPELGRLSGNPVLHLFIDVLTRLTARYARTSRRIPKAQVQAAKQASHQAHRATVDAVIAGDGARAQTNLTAHLEAIAAWIREHRVRQAAHISGSVIEPEQVEGPRAKLAEVVAARIHDDISARGRQVGSVLGSETALIARYRISRAALREAVRILEYHSVARMRRGPGGGLIVTEPEPQASIDTMALFLKYQDVTAEDFHLARSAIELGIVNQVVQRQPGDDVAERLNAVIQLPAEGPRMGLADEFHKELAAIAGNPILALFLNISTELFRRHATAQNLTFPQDPAALTEVQHVHQRILDAVLSGDAELAQHRMRRHLQALTHWWH